MRAPTSELGGEPFCQHRLLSTSQVDEAEAVGARLITENRLRLPRRHSFAARINGVCLNTVSLYYMNYGTQLDVESAPLNNTVAVLLPLDGTMRVRHRGAEFEAVANRVAGVISPDADLYMKWGPDLATWCLLVDRTMLQEFAQCLLGSNATGTLTFDPVMHRPAAVQAMVAQARLIQDVFERSESASGLAAPLYAQLREQFMTTLLAAHTHSFTELLFAQPTRLSQRAVRQAREIIEADTADPPTVAALARRVGVSARALQLGFQRELGSSPASYMREVRLARARTELLASESTDGKTIMDVALRWGFTHASRFAGYYQQRYHESPSATLRRDSG